MTVKKSFIITFSFIFVFLIFTGINKANEGAASMISEASKKEAITKLIEKYGDTHKANIEKGVNQAASLWRKEDGSEKDFMNFCMNNYLADKKLREKTFKRFETNFETILGNYLKISRELSAPLQLEMGTLLPADYLFAEFSPNTHFDDDLFNTKIAFVVLLNFPLYSLEEKMDLG